MEGKHANRADILIDWIEPKFDRMLQRKLLDKLSIVFLLDPEILFSPMLLQRDDHSTALQRAAGVHVGTTPAQRIFRVGSGVGPDAPRTKSIYECTAVVVLVIGDKVIVGGDQRLKEIAEPDVGDGAVIESSNTDVF